MNCLVQKEKFRANTFSIIKCQMLPCRSRDRLPFPRCVCAHTLDEDISCLKLRHAPRELIYSSIASKYHTRKTGPLSYGLATYVRTPNSHWKKPPYYPKNMLNRILSLRKNNKTMSIKSLWNPNRRSRSSNEQVVIRRWNFHFNHHVLPDTLVQKLHNIQKTQCLQSIIQLVPSCIISLLHQTDMSDILIDFGITNQPRQVNQIAVFVEFAVITQNIRPVTDLLSMVRTEPEETVPVQSFSPPAPKPVLQTKDDTAQWPDTKQDRRYMRRYRTWPEDFARFWGSEILGNMCVLEGVNSVVHEL